MQRVAVAVGILERADGRVLLTRRPLDKLLPGYLEFPGGKIEPGESPGQALVRELGEEIGVHVDPADLQPVIRCEHEYPGFTVCLHAYRVGRWRGIPVGAEDQFHGWYERTELADLTLPPANRPVLNALALPPALRVTPLLSEADIPHFAVALVQALGEANSNGIVIRVANDLALACLRDRIEPLLASSSRPVLLNTGDVRELPVGFSGRHLPASILRSLKRRPAGRGWLGASVHDVAEACQARALGLDYVIVGNVAPTPTHPGTTPLGWPRFGEIAAAANLPAYAIGGVSPEDLGQVRSLWGQGVAGIRAFWS